MFLKYLHNHGHLSDEALLLSIYPLKVCYSDVRKQFWEYIPPDHQQQELRCVRTVPFQTITTAMLIHAGQTVGWQLPVSVV